MQPDPPTLTPREAQVLDLFGDGCDRSEIALLLGISKATVTAHATHACVKLGACSIPQGVRLLDRLTAKTARVQETPVSVEHLHI